MKSAPNMPKSEALIADLLDSLANEFNIIKASNSKNSYKRQLIIAQTLIKLINISSKIQPENEDNSEDKNINAEDVELLNSFFKTYKQE